MKGYYFYYGSMSAGVESKVDFQIKELNHYFNVKKIKITRKKMTVLDKMISIIPMGNLGYEYEKALKEIQSPDFIYIRRTNADSKFVWFLRQIKKTYPECKIIEEIPSYPYIRDNYCYSAVAFVTGFYRLMKDYIYSHKIYRYVDRIATFTDDSRILNIPTLNIMNGIDVDSISVVRSKYDENTINMVSVAMMAAHHGYERFIKGLSDYYLNGGRKRIIYHCVGNGEQCEYYKKLVKKLQLDEHVIFYGEKKGKELEELYNSMHIGLDCFGLYKDGRYKFSSLKAREYLAKGLPVVSCVGGDVFYKYPTEYCIEFPNDNSVIDVERIVMFYKELYQNNQDIHLMIHEYAKNTVDMSIALNNLVEYLNSNKTGESI